MGRPRQWFVSVAAVMAVIGSQTAIVAQGPAGSDSGSAFDFGLIGDQAYTADQQAKSPELVQRMNAADLAFTVHDGDIGADPTDCTDDYYRKTKGLFDEFAAPLVYTPGDNEWLDCRHEGYDPIQRLASLRRVFFSTDQSAGKRTLRLERQWPDYPENARWTYGPVTFATLHVVGSHDGLGDGEFAARRAATVDWLNQTFDVAARNGSAGVALSWQADPFFQQDVPAYNGIRGALRARTIAFGKPVVLVHGDSHQMRIDHPMADDHGRVVENFTRVETFGPADVAWVRATVDPSDPALFSFRPEILPGTGVPGVPVVSPCGVSAVAPAVYDHVVWIWMENKTHDQVVGSRAAPYETTLARQCGTATNYSAVGKPSLPNYLAATSGHTYGIANDRPPAVHRLRADNLFRQVRALGLTERSYQEDMPGSCALESAGVYAVKHNPAAYYDGGRDRAACRANDVALGTTVAGALASDLDDDTLPAFSFVTPNLCNDTHDCPVKRGDVWLSVWLPRILASPAYRSGVTAVFVVWDEPTPIPNIVISPTTPRGTASGLPFDHYSLLRTTEEMLGISTLLGRAASAPSMRSAFRL